MKAKLQKELFEKYPVMFKNRYRDFKKGDMILPIDFGIEIGDGWYWLISHLLECIDNYIKNNKHLNIPEITIDQVKEKYGSLKFYFSGGNDKIEGMVWFAEHLSEYICEECGSSEGKNEKIGGWYSTRCKNCR